LEEKELYKIILFNKILLILKVGINLLINGSEKKNEYLLNFIVKSIKMQKILKFIKI
jgi:hypothetical protein